MPRPQDLDCVYMNTALLHSWKSRSRRKSVGAVLKPYRNCCKVFHYERIRLNNESRK